MLSDFLLMFFSHSLQGSVLCSILYSNDCSLVSHVEMNGIVRSFPQFVFFVFLTSVQILPSKDCFGRMSDIIN